MNRKQYDSLKNDIRKWQNTVKEQEQKDLEVRFGKVKSEGPDNSYELKLARDILKVEERIKTILHGDGYKDSYYCKKEHLCENAESNPDCSGCVLACKLRHVMDGIPTDMKPRQTRADIQQSTMDGFKFFEFENWPKCRSCDYPLTTTDYNRIAVQGYYTAVKREQKSSVDILEKCAKCGTSNRVSIMVDSIKVWVQSDYF